MSWSGNFLADWKMFIRPTFMISGATWCRSCCVCTNSSPDADTEHATQEKLRQVVMTSTSASLRLSKFKQQSFVINGDASPKFKAHYLSDWYSQLTQRFHLPINIKHNEHSSNNWKMEERMEEGRRKEGVPTCPTVSSYLLAGSSPPSCATPFWRASRGSCFGPSTYSCWPLRMVPL